MSEDPAIASQPRPKYPSGVFAMFTIQLLVMIGFIMVLSLLVLYCTRQLGMSDTKAYTLFAAYNALVFASSVFGGYLGERYLGYRYAVVLSIILGSIGLFIIIIPKVIALYWGLAIFTISTGIFLPCSYVLLGRLYDQENDPRRDSGFTVAYIGMNIGGFMASVTSGYIANNFGYGVAFFIGGFFALMALIVFLVYRHHFVPDHQNKLGQRRLEKAGSIKVTGLFLVAFSLPLTMVLLNFADLSNILMIVLGVLSIGLVIYLSRFETPKYRKKLIAFLFLTVISVAFWALYTITPSALTIFISRNVDRHLLGTTIPAASYTSLNPLFIITIGPLLTFLWMYLNQRGRKISTPAKFALGVISMGVGYLILVLAIVFHEQQGYISSWWIVLSYFFQTFGELFVGPIGFAMVGELVPPRLEGLMMGIWQLATGVAGALSEYMANMTIAPQHQSLLQSDTIYSHAFALFGSITVVVGIIAVLLVPYLKRIIGHEKSAAHSEYSM